MNEGFDSRDYEQFPLGDYELEEHEIYKDRLVSVFILTEGGEFDGAGV